MGQGRQGGLSWGRGARAVRAANVAMGAAMAAKAVMVARMEWAVGGSGE